MLFGPLRHTFVAVAQATGVPYFLTDGARSLSGEHMPNNVFNVMPDKSAQIKAVIDAIDKFRWKDIAVLYDNDQGMTSLIIVCVQ